MTWLSRPISAVMNRVLTNGLLCLCFTLAFVQTEEEPEAKVVTVYNGKDATLPCSTRLPNEVTWKNPSDVLLTVGLRRVVQDNRFSPNQKNLVIRNVNYCDVGIYTCVSVHSSTKPIQKVKLEVSGPPIVAVSPREVVARLGDSVVLGCTVSSHPMQDMLWKKNAKNVRIGSKYKILFECKVHSMANFSLQILSVRQKDYGKYYCIAQNKHGFDKKSVYLLNISDQTTRTSAPRHATSRCPVGHTQPENKSHQRNGVANTKIKQFFTVAITTVVYLLFH